MRGGFAFLIALLALTGSARADVFVPADPRQAPEDARCQTAGGDLFVAASDTRVVVSESGGPWRRLAGLTGCPRVAAALDGTAAIAASDDEQSRLVIRPPGGRFGPPLEVGGGPALAVAPGGWVAAASVVERGIEVLVRTPSGTIDRASLPDDGTTVGAPELGIAADGTATVVWTSWRESDGVPQRLRSARSVAGGGWAMAPDIPTGEWGIYPPYSGESLIDVAVSPAGRTLMTWVTDDGVRASLDGEPSALVARGRSKGTLRAVVNDAGAALVAFGGGRGRVMVAERPAGGAWLAARVVSGRRTTFEFNERDDGGPRSIEMDAALSATGTAVVAWPADTLVAAVGRPGGPWSRAATASSPLLRLVGWELSLGPGGAPQLHWNERIDESALTHRQRASRLVADAATDVTAPRLATRLPSRLPATDTGSLLVRAPVRCSEACDALLSLTVPGVAADSVNLSLRAGKRRTLELAAWRLAPSLLMRPGLRRVRVDVVVADRAGNVAHRSRTLRVRVIERPLRSFKVPADQSFSMFSRAGDRAVAGLVNALIEGLAGATIRTQTALDRRYRDGERAIVRAGHDEIGDTEVRDRIFEALEVPCGRVGLEVP